jgi:protein SCO1/2
MFRLPSRLNVLIHLIITLSVYAFISTFAFAHEGHHHEHTVIKAIGGNFTLNSASGPVSLSDYHGKIVAIYFGFSHCTDTCPLDLSRLSTAIKTLKPDEVEQIQPLFITLDPSRDDAKRMAESSANYHPKLIGLTGTDSEIANVTKAYGLHFKKGEVDAKGDYDIDHPSVIYIVGRNGELLNALTKISSPARIAIELHKALKQKTS